jgi:hypothetical protein
MSRVSSTTAARVLLGVMLGAEQLQRAVRRRADDRDQHDRGAGLRRRVDEAAAA